MRALYKQIRLRMSQSEVSTKSRLINRRLINEIEWAKYKKVCVYQPVASLNEVDIIGLISRLQKQAELDLFVVEPHKKAAVPAKKFDLIIVPCLAYDDDNHRLGWGGGWYDKFLAGQSQAEKVGVCFSSGHIEGGIPHEPHDIALNKVITEI